MDMKIALIQSYVDKDVAKNIENMAIQLSQCKEADIVLLPEMWTVPYENKAMKASIVYQSEAMDLLQKMSHQNHQRIIGGTMAEKAGSSIYNTCFVYDKGQLVTSYRKMHLMHFHGRIDYTEADVFRPGDQFCVVDHMGILVCYDIRFCEQARILAQHGAKILFVPAAFNQAVGKAHWDILCRTRALENEVFLCAVNPAYTYQNYTSYGHSMIVDPNGQKIMEMDEKPGIAMADIDLSQIDRIRQRMPFWQIRRTDLYTCKEKENEMDRME